jgi:acetamidase/formamidase
MDTKHITKGSKLYLPVQVKGALFSLGDGHAAQGDGECCGKLNRTTEIGKHHEIKVTFFKVLR